ncbi:MAG: C10 family peptidase [Bacteroidaceae bacterium]|nr:C10 family peptidase [Bacteroidaceae bacterium]
MKKFFTVLVSCLVACMSLMSQAEIISQEVAVATAESILMQDNEWNGAGDVTVRLVEHEGVPAYYVIEYSEGGWALIAAQSTSDPLIGYNHTGAYVAPEPMQYVLDMTAKRIVREAQLSAENHVAWSEVMHRKPAADIESTPDVAPLITINLNQGYPYNNECPTIDGQRALVGCVAVGMAQAMMVARFPLRPNGKHSYSSQNAGFISINYDEEKDYDWDAMYASEETGNYDEIARLVYHCGVSVNMEYGIDGSGAITPLVAEALPRNFGYDETLVRYIDKPKTDKEWLEILLDELILGRVIVYRGQSEDSGHCWNLDGWKQSTQTVHVNWGWGGYGNGYYKINAMEDKYQDMSFPYDNGAILGVGAPTTAPYGINLSSTKFAIGTEAGVALADVVVACEDEEADFVFELFGPKNLAGKYTTSPYEVVDGKLISTKTLADSNAFKFLLIKVTNANTGESYERQFTIQIVSSDAVESVMSDAMRVYPSVAADVLTIEVPVVGGSYAIYSVAGAQVQAGALDSYKNEVNVSDLAAGTYILQYVHNDGVGVKTFIKK